MEQRKALETLLEATQELSILQARMQTLAEREEVKALRSEVLAEKNSAVRERSRDRQHRHDVLRLRQEVAKLKERQRANRAALRAEMDAEQRKDLRHDLSSTQRRLLDFEERLSRAQRTANVFHRSPSHNEQDHAGLAEHAVPATPYTEPDSSPSGSTVHGTAGIDVPTPQQDSASQKLADAQKRLSQAEDAVRADMEAAQARAEHAEKQLDDELLRAFTRGMEEHGVGVAWLKGRMCQGCYMELDPMALQEIRETPPDELPRCPECSVLLLLRQDEHNSH